VPRDLETVCLKCLRRDPGQRYATAAELAADLRRFLDHQPVRACPLGVAGRLWNWCRRPERIRDAAVACWVTATVGFATASTGLLLILVGVLLPSDSVAGICYMLVTILGFVPALIWTARATVAGNRAALFLGMFLPFGLLVYQFGPMTGFFPTGGVVDPGNMPPTMPAHVATLTALELVQAASFVIALIAYHANRHVPGFLPDRPSRGAIPRPLVR
jgi:hypothetical protein